MCEPFTLGSDTSCYNTPYETISFLFWGTVMANGCVVWSIATDCSLSLATGQVLILAGECEEVASDLGLWFARTGCSLPLTIGQSWLNLDMAEKWQ